MSALDKKCVCGHVTGAHNDVGCHVVTCPCKEFCQLREARLVRTALPAALPTEALARKAVPIFSGVIKYFPRALAAVAECSRAGGEQHNPGKPLHWDRSKSGDELDALSRHLLDAGTVDTDKVRHSTKVAWRALANLEKELEAAESGAGG